MFSRAVLDTSRTRVRTFGSDDAGHLVRALTRQVTLDDPGLAPVVGVIAPQLFIHHERPTVERLSRFEGQNVKREGQKTREGTEEN